MQTWLVDHKMVVLGAVGVFKHRVFERLDTPRSKVRLARCRCTLGPGGALPVKAGASLRGGVQHGVYVRVRVSQGWNRIGS